MTMAARPTDTQNHTMQNNRLTRPKCDIVRDSVQFGQHVCRLIDRSSSFSTYHITPSASGRRSHQPVTPAPNQTTHTDRPTDRETYLCVNPACPTVRVILTSVRTSCSSAVSVAEQHRTAHHTTPVRVCVCAVGPSVCEAPLCDGCIDERSRHSREHTSHSSVSQTDGMAADG